MPKATHESLDGKVMLLIDTWQEAFGGRGGRYPQYYASYNELKNEWAPVLSRATRHYAWHLIQRDQILSTRGDKEFTTNIRLKMNYMPRKYKLSLALMEVLGIEVDTRSRIIAGIWHYVKARKLQNPDDPSYFNCDPAFRKPIHLEHKIKLSENSPAGNVCYDVLVDVPFPIQRELNDLLATRESRRY
ncbi:SWI/SNF complex component SNF12 [Tanacetum coccineum]